MTKYGGDLRKRDNYGGLTTYREDAMHKDLDKRSVFFPVT